MTTDLYEAEISNSVPGFRHKARYDFRILASTAGSNLCYCAIDEPL